MVASVNDKLTLKQRRFVEEYTADGNAVQAYFRAFGRYTQSKKRRTYHGATWAVQQLLKNPVVQAEIQAAEAAYAKRVRVSKARALREVAALAFADAGDVYEADEQNNGLPKPKRWDDIPPAARKAIQSVKVRRRLIKDAAGDAWRVEELEYRFHDKAAALDKLCRKLGFYAEEKPTDGSRDKAHVELMATLAALLATRQPQPIGPGHTSGAVSPGAPVDAQPGATGGSVPQPS